MLYTEVNNNKKQNLLTCQLFFLKKWPTPASFSFIFVFSNKHYNYYNK